MYFLVAATLFVQVGPLDYTPKGPSNPLPSVTNNGSDPQHLLHAIWLPTGTPWFFSPQRTLQAAVPATR